MKKTDVLIIGGGPAGIIAATTAKHTYPDKDVLLIRKEKEVLIPCGIPYIFGTLENSDQDVIPDTILSKDGVHLEIDEVISVNRKDKIARTVNGIDISFEKLVFATGSISYVPQWLKGTELENVFTVKKNREYLDEVKVKLQHCKRIVVIGGGFIGVEISDELNKIGKDVTIVEVLPHILCLAMDREIAIEAEKVIRARGVKLKTGIGAKEISGNGNVTGVLLENGEKVMCDMVILAIGYRPNSSLAKEAKLRIGYKGAIWVDEYMRTDDPDIFAVGDCVEKKCFVTRKLINVMLASTAASEARIAGENLYKLGVVKTFSGTIAIFSTVIGDTGFGSAGLTEEQAKKEGFDIVVGTSDSIDKHPGILSGAHKQKVKLVVAKKSGVILGGYVMGGISTGELINIIGMAIQNRMTVNSFLSLQIGTHPLLTASPMTYPIIKTAESLTWKVELGFRKEERQCQNGMKKGGISNE